MEIKNIIKEELILFSISFLFSVIFTELTITVLCFILNDIALQMIGRNLFVAFINATIFHIIVLPFRIKE